jgi:hypothetical protein
VADQDKRDEESLEADPKPLPDRELTSLIDGNVVIPINGAVAANVLSEDSFTGAEAERDTDVEQESNGNDTENNN